MSDTIHKTEHAFLDRVALSVAKVIFGLRAPLLFVFVVATLALGYQASKLRPDASFEKMIPVDHPYIEKYFQHIDDLRALGNSVRVIVEVKDGDIFTPEFQEVLSQINDEVFYIPGVDRSGLQSLWSPNVRWSEVTEEGFVGGAVIPKTYDGSEESLRQLRANTLRSGQVGRLVANNFKAATVLAPLSDTDPTTGERLNYQELSEALETQVRDKYQSENVVIHITGFAKVVGDLIDGASQVAIFFAVAFLITMVLLYLYSRCYWSTIMPLLCSTVAVVWQLGLLHTLGYGLDPYSMLVPFLVFAIGISHGVQIINGIARNCLHGAAPIDASRAAFCSLFIAGMVALFSDGIGFFTLRVIEIPVIQELAIAASLGVAVLVMTQLVLLPLLMSYTGISTSCNRYLESKRESNFTHWRLLSNFAAPPAAIVAICIAALLLGVGLYTGKDQKIGDLDPGAPELRADSRYNMDNKFLTDNFATSTDVLVVMAETPPQKCGNYSSLAAIDYFQGYMENVPGVQSALSLVNISKMVIWGMNEGDPRWFGLSRNQYVINNSLNSVPGELMNTDCSMVPLILYLDDHKADTLTRVTSAVEEFAAEYNSDAISFELAAGNSGVEAATNVVIAKAQYVMLMWVYGVVTLLCLLTFRSVKTVLCIIIPLALTSVLAQGLMASIGIGVKVATMPVIALGVGIGVDYGIYIYTRLDDFLGQGMSLQDAYYETLRTTGTAVAFTGFTLAIGVGTWIYSPIKFQADMGIMLTFMFLWNMVGALTLLPALTWLLRGSSIEKSRAAANS